MKKLCYCLFGLFCLFSFNAEAQKKKHPVAKTNDNQEDCYPTEITSDGIVYITYAVSIWLDADAVEDLSDCDETFVVFRDAISGNVLTSIPMSAGNPSQFPFSGDVPTGCVDTLVHILNFSVDLPINVDCQYFGDKESYDIELELMGQDDEGNFISIEESPSAQGCLTNVLPDCILDLEQTNLGLTSYSEQLNICCQHSTLPFTPLDGGGLIPPSNGGLGNLSLKIIVANPNPFADQLSVSITAPKAGVGQLRLLNINGQVMIDESVSVVEGINEVDLDVLDLLSGIYILKWTLDDSTTTEQVIKMEE